MKNEISHNWNDESLEAKARWFKSLSLSERMEVMVAFTDLLFSLNPNIVEQKNAQPVKGRIQVISRT